MRCGHSSPPKRAACPTHAGSSTRRSSVSRRTGGTGSSAPGSKPDPATAPMSTALWPRSACSRPTRRSFCPSPGSGPSWGSCSGGAHPEPRLEIGEGFHAEAADRPELIDRLESVVLLAEGEHPGALADREAAVAKLLEGGGVQIRLPPCRPASLSPRARGGSLRPGPAVPRGGLA